MKMALSETEATAMWNEPWRKKLREADAIKMTLEQRMRDMDQLEADAKATAAREKVLNAPASPEEAKILERQRITEHVDKIMGTSGNDLSEVPASDFAKAFGTKHVGFADGRTAGEHLRDLRLGQNQPEPIVEDEVVDDTGLHEILRRGTRK
jgi:hypothetical protein